MTSPKYCGKYEVRISHLGNEWYADAFMYTYCCHRSYGNSEEEAFKKLRRWVNTGIEEIEEEDNG